MCWVLRTAYLGPFEVTGETGLHSTLSMYIILSPKWCAADKKDGLASSLVGRRPWFFTGGEGYEIIPWIRMKIV